MSDDGILEQDAAAFAAGYRPKPRESLTDIPIPPRPRRRRPGYFALSIPLALFVAVPLFFIAAVSLCGFYSCSGGGWGPSFGFSWLTWVLCFVIGGVFAFAVGVVPWTRTREGQVYTAIVTGSVVTIALMAYFYSVLY